MVSPRNYRSFGVLLQATQGLPRVLIMDRKAYSNAKQRVGNIKTAGITAVGCAGPLSLFLPAASRALEAADLFFVKRVPYY